MKIVGTVTMRDGEDGVREVALTDMVRSHFKDNRLCTVARTEMNTFVLAIENPPSSGRCPINQMHLSEDSMLALIAAVFCYYDHQGIDINKKMEELINSDKIEIEYIDNEEHLSEDSRPEKG